MPGSLVKTIPGASGAVVANVVDVHSSQWPSPCMYQRRLLAVLGSYETEPEEPVLDDPCCLGLKCRETDAWLGHLGNGFLRVVNDLVDLGLFF